jgi:hypothetical protein
MRFIVLARGCKDFEADVLPNEKILARMANYFGELVKAGVVVAGGPLEPSSKGARVRCASGKAAVIDGPFPETGEQVGGFFLIEANSKDEAIEWARRMPVEEGEVEVRPLFQLPEFPDAPAGKSGGGRPEEQQLRATPLPRKPGTVCYIALVKADKATEAGILPDQEFISAMGKFLEAGAKSGVVLSADGLQPTSKGARVRYSGSKRTVIDGPFAETKELIAGFVILQFASRAEAIDWAERFVQVDAPGRLGRESQCEIRPLLELDATMSGR